MKKRTYTIAVGAAISAPPTRCYEALADYRSAHAQIIPPRYFGPLEVIAGGHGAGTRFRCSLRMFGQTVPFSAEVTEPVPGRVLVETMDGPGAVTTFTVVQENAGARVTFETRVVRRSGLTGAIERLVTRRTFPRMFAEELERLAAHVGGSIVGSPTVALVDD